jgi:ribosomal-protein-alanine N-acetyltransferase
MIKLKTIDEDLKKYSAETKRLILRPMIASDYPQWKEAYAEMLPPQNKWDTANRKKIGEKSEFNRLLKRFKLERKTETFFDYLVIDKKTKKIVGRYSLMNFVRSITQSGIIGYSLFNQYWGAGYGREALEALIALGFKKHHLRRLIAGIEPENKRSKALAKRCGLYREGICKGLVYIRGDWQDLEQFVIINKKFKFVKK